MQDLLSELRKTFITNPKYRMTICKQCPSLQGKLNQCKECGCFMDAKVLIKTTKCPLGKW